MRRFGFALTTLLAAWPAFAQPPAQPAPPAPGTGAPAAKDPLDEHLARWEAEMQKIETLWAQLQLSVKDKAFDTVKESEGAAYYMKSGKGANTLNLAVLELRKKGKTDPEKRFVCTGTFLYEMLYDEKTIRAFEVPQPKPGQVGNDNFLAFMFGMKAEEAKKRYTLSIPKDKVDDKHYVYIDIQPKAAVDKSDFARARLVLSKQTYLPRQLWFEQANGSEVKWEIPDIRTPVQTKREFFDAPKTPQGWKFIEEPRAKEAQPRVVRPKD